jgi:hypothetical protein
VRARERQKKKNKKILKQFVSHVEFYATLSALDRSFTADQTERTTCDDVITAPGNTSGD